MKNLIILFLTIIGITPAVALGELNVPTIFTDNMVLQQNDSVAIWGNAMSNQTVTIVTSWGETEAVTADNAGVWKMKLKTREASFVSQTINIKTNTDTIALSNILIGEVWLCSGQSNMLFRLKFEDNGDTEIANASNVPLRLFKVPSITSAEPLDNIEDASWKLCSSASVKNFSAVAYYFGENLLANLTNTPVGIISAAFGSSTVEAFMSKEALLSKPYLADYYNNYVTKVPSKVPSSCFNAMIYPYFLSSNLYDSHVDFSSEKKIVFDERNITTSVNDFKKNGNFEILDKFLDDCFVLNSKEILFNTPKYNLELSSSEKDSFLQLYTPPHKNTIAIEPTTGVSDSFNNGIGLKTLQPSETYKISWNLKINDKKL